MRLRPVLGRTYRGVRRTLGQIRAYLGANTYTAAATDQLSRRARAAFYLTRLSIRILKQWARDKCPQQAAALAFNTALSLVPVTAIAFTILRSVGSLDAQSRLSDFIANRLFPGMEDITDRIEGFSRNISVGALGGAGLFFTIITCYSLYGYVERIFNDIWRVGQRRTLIGKFLTFYAMVTLLPALASMSLYWSGKLVGANTAARFLAPLAIQVAGLVLMNKLLAPHQRQLDRGFGGGTVYRRDLGIGKVRLRSLREEDAARKLQRRIRLAGPDPALAAVDLRVVAVGAAGRGDRVRGSESARARGRGSPAAR